LLRINPLGAAGAQAIAGRDPTMAMWHGRLHSSRGDRSKPLFGESHQA
jgi:hypothetical protein